MDIQLIRAPELTQEQMDVWRRWMRSSNATDSPFFDPQYAIELSAFREPVRVAILRENGAPVGFFAFEKHGRVGRPLGIKLCDFQGVVCAPETQLDARLLLDGCGLNVLNFDHLLASQSNFCRWHWRQHDSFYADISGGYDAYVAAQRAHGSRFIPQMGQKRRKLEKKEGPLTFEWQSKNERDWKVLLEWKSIQRRETKTFDVLQYDWVQAFLERLRDVRSDSFSGVFSTLKIGNQLIAASFGLLSPTARHIWVASYSHELERYSPGNILRLAVMREAAARGMRRIDFGKGNERYKKTLKTDRFLVAEGALDRNPIRHLARSALYKSYEKFRGTSAAPLVNAPKRFIRGMGHEKTMAPFK